MKRIEISVKNLVAWQTNSTDYVCGTSKFVVCFDFDKEWNEFETKTARFYHGGEHTDIVFTGTECKVPKIFDVKRMEVGVFAGDLNTTTPAVVGCRKSILCKSGTPADPTPDVYAQVMDLLNKGVSDEKIEKAVEAYLLNNPSGVPSGGKTGQYLRKKSDEDRDVEWADFEIPKEYGLITYDQDKTITIT